MTNIKIVIGANFGDEGKGLMTDYFSNQAAMQNENCIVVCSNGGAQRGHTVTTPDNIRHVFHHFGSGTFNNTHTYLSKYFILNPMIFCQEWKELNEIGFIPKVYVHPLCKISTPFDMILNQMIEEKRSEDRHGSCGVGIYETLKRCHYPKYNFYLLQLFVLGSDDIRNLLYRIRDEYFLEKLKEENIDINKSEWDEIVYSTGLIDKYIDDIYFMKDCINKCGDEILCHYANIIFENGQGLLLDQNNGSYYPHLTPSNTGVKNPLEIIGNTFPKEKINIETCYVTRTYITRHGVGRLEDECEKADINRDMVDYTNVPNPHQGILRYAKLDEQSLEECILKDFELIRKYGTKLSLAVTHGNEYEYIFSDKFKKNYDYIYYSDGETRKSLRRTYERS